MQEQLDKHTALISAILNLTHRRDGSSEQFKAELQLIDGSHLHINEVYISGELRKYAYYRLTPTGQVLQGWDNAPHHAEVATFPHHVHRHGAVHASEVRNLNKVLALLQKLLVKS